MSGFHSVTPGAVPLPPSNTCALACRERAVAEVRRGRFRRVGLQPGHKPTPANIFFPLYLGERGVAHRDRVRGLCLSAMKAGCHGQCCSDRGFIARGNTHGQEGVVRGYQTVRIWWIG